MSALDTILDAKTAKRRGCRVCGEPTAAYVAVRIHELAAKGSFGKRSLSQGGSFCVEHGAELWAKLTALLDGDAA